MRRHQTSKGDGLGRKDDDGALLKAFLAEQTTLKSKERVNAGSFLVKNGE